jgi:hypothetical protein
MTQRKIDDLFSHKRSRVHQTRDEFDDLFETNSSIKRRRIDQKPITTDVFDFPSSSSTLKKKRSSTNIIDDENKAIDDLFNNDTRKKLRRPIKTEESSMDLLDMFKTPIHSKTQKKIKMFFDDTDLIALPEQTDTVNRLLISINPFIRFLERLYSNQTCDNHRWTMVIKRRGH